MVLVLSVLAGCQAPPDEDPVEVVFALWQAGAERLCGDPELRSTLGPFAEGDGGADWQRGQRVAPDNAAGWTKGRGVVVEDFDGNGRFDIFLPNQGPDQLYLGLAGGLFSDQTAENWVDVQDRTTGGSSADFDGDGDLDLLAVNRGGANRLYVNDGAGKFEVASDVGLSEEPWGSTGSSWGDIDGDGDLDLLVFAHFVAPPDGWDPEAPGPAEPSELYLNNGDGTFSDASELIPDYAHDSYTYGGGLHDLDGDRDPDLYLVNDFGPSAIPNLHFRTDRTPSGVDFVDVSDEHGTGLSVWGMGMGLGDVNGDHRPDLACASWDELVLLESTADGRWEERAVERGLVPELGLRDLSWGIEIADLDNDGLEDVIVAFGWLQDDHLGLENPETQPDALYLQEEDGTFSQVAETWGLADSGPSRGLALADLNQDGWLDVVKRDLWDDARFYESRCGSSHWLRVRLSQPGLNSLGVGAEIRVEAGDRAWTRWIHAGGTSYASSGPIEAHFGLGEASLVDRLVVTWPDGGVSEVFDVEVDRVGTLVRVP